MKYALAIFRLVLKLITGQNPDAGSGRGKRVMHGAFTSKCPQYGVPEP